MNNGVKEIITDLKAMGINKGDRLMLHTSYKSMGKIDGGMSAFFKAVTEAVGDSGTIMLPTFSYDYVTQENPVFDVLSTKTCVGAMPDFFRTLEGVKRSVHPTHSLAVWGDKRDWYIKEHVKDQYDVAENSPLFKLKDTGGKILMIGCGTTHNTLIHGVETLLKPDYCYTVDYNNPVYHREFACIDEKNTVHRTEYFAAYAESVGGYAQRFDKLGNLMEIKKGNILCAESFIMDAAEVWETTYNKMRKDPYYFREKIM